ncbi:MAG: DUF3179 domain-containing protein [Rhodospirillales bacterium]|nr:MAG: DUF3179 domain-containing protein [Rhodospirillales bacterium]
MVAAGAAMALPEYRRAAWPNTDFGNASVPLDEIFSGGPPRDGIPPIDDPRFVPVPQVTDLTDTEPVIGVVIDGVAKAYPLRILIWHEIVNDVVDDVPVAVTFCPLCNAAMVFDRRVDTRVLDFGTTGMLRNSDLVMYDRQTESWWQQFLGAAIVGELNGTILKVLPSRLESWSRFRKRAPEGLVLVPNNPAMRAYGRNPYDGYDSSARPFLYDGKTPPGIAPLARVVSLPGRSEAWSLELLRVKRTIALPDGTVMSWEPGQNSALGDGWIPRGQDVGNILVRREVGGAWHDVPYFVDFAFAFHAFYPEAKIHLP